MFKYPCWFLRVRLNFNCTSLMISYTEFISLFLFHLLVSPSVLLSLFLPLGPIDSCTGQDLADLGDRLRDWFQLLQGNAKQNNTRKPTAATSASSKAQSCQLSAQPLIWCWTRLHQLTFAEAAKIQSSLLRNRTELECYIRNVLVCAIFSI